MNGPRNMHVRCLEGRLQRAVDLKRIGKELVATYSADPIPDAGVNGFYRR